MLEDIQNLFNITKKSYTIKNTNNTSLYSYESVDLYLNKDDYFKFKEKYEELGFKIRIGNKNRKFSHNPEAEIAIINIEDRSIKNNLFIIIKRDYNEDKKHKLIIKIYNY